VGGGGSKITNKVKKKQHKTKGGKKINKLKSKINIDQNKI
jgi:hypothetical protein